MKKNIIFLLLLYGSTLSGQSLKDDLSGLIEQYQLRVNDVLQHGSNDALTVQNGFLNLFDNGAQLVPLLGGKLLSPKVYLDSLRNGFSDGCQVSLEGIGYCRHPDAAKREKRFFIHLKQSFTGDYLLLRRQLNAQLLQFEVERVAAHSFRILGISKSKYTSAQLSDDDGDSVPAVCDKCLCYGGGLEYDGAHKDEPCQCSDVPEPDTDGDGIPDKVDSCPTVAGVREYQGCPPPKPKPSFSDFTETATGVSFVMKAIRGGTFQMGSDDSEAYSDEKPVHSVRVDNFYIGRYEVTIGEFRKFMNASDYKTDAEKEGTSYCYINGSWTAKTGVNWRHDEKGEPQSIENVPVIHVSWNDAVAYCKWLSSVSSRQYRLPTEAEWEYAARGGQSSKYAGSDDVGSVAWYWDNGEKKPHPVGQKRSNQYGLYDMSGNVWEWCSDWYSSYSSAAVINPVGAATGSYRVLRGGSWDNYPRNVRVAYRGSFNPSFRNSDVGFRLALLSSAK
jgi:formylglycine-generating enzyme required for sulfatase activity